MVVDVDVVVDARVGTGARAVDIWRGMTGLSVFDVGCEQEVEEEVESGGRGGVVVKVVFAR